MVKGKTYGSKASAFQVLVRSEAVQYHPGTGVEIGRVPALTAEFAKHGAEYEYTDGDGNIQKAPDIRGHYFNSAAAQQENGWSDDERESVEAALDRLCERWPEAVWPISAAKAEKPWPTYDETHHKQIPSVAQTIGKVADALQYEQENKNRSEVVEKLGELLNAAQNEAAVEDSLTAA